MFADENHIAKVVGERNCSDGLSIIVQLDAIAHNFFI